MSRRNNKRMKIEVETGSHEHFINQHGRSNTRAASRIHDAMESGSMDEKFTNSLMTKQKLDFCF